MRLFYEPDVTRHWLSPEESHHCVKVLRMRKGALIQLVDGKGNFYKVEILEADPKKCTFSIIEEITQPPDNFYTHVALAPTKNIDRMAWMVEKCVEIGTHEISFLTTKNTERKILKEEKLKKIAIQAMKQSRRAFLPKINSLITFKTFLQRSPTEEQLFIAHIAEQGEHYPVFAKLLLPAKRCCILVGPEGDFTQQEVAAALEKNYLAVSLGNNRLRTETAGLVACHTIHLVNMLS